MKSRLYHIWFYVPDSYKERVKEALFAAGAGALGDYSRCCWEVKGTGQFMPMAGSSPAIGACDRLERLEEYKVEMVVEKRFLSAAVKALKEAHPYEEPAFGAVRIRSG